MRSAFLASLVAGITGGYNPWQRTPAESHTKGPTGARRNYLRRANRSKYQPHQGRQECARRAARGW